MVHLTVDWTKPSEIFTMAANDLRQLANDKYVVNSLPDSFYDVENSITIIHPAAAFVAATLGYGPKYEGSLSLDPAEMELFEALFAFVNGDAHGCFKSFDISKGDKKHLCNVYYGMYEGNFEDIEKFEEDDINDLAEVFAKMAQVCKNRKV